MVRSRHRGRSEFRAALRYESLRGLRSAKFSTGKKANGSCTARWNSTPTILKRTGSWVQFKWPGEISKPPRRYHEKAMELSPNDAYIKARSAAFHIFVGMPRRALQLLSEAEALDPYLPVWCVQERGVALYAQERYREAIKHLSAQPFQTRRSRLYHTAARVALGEIGEAQKLARAATQLGLTVQYVRDQEWYRDRSRSTLEKLVQRLIEAGIPERSTSAPAESMKRPL